MHKQKTAEQEWRSMKLPALIEWRKDKIDVPFSTELSINLGDDPELMRLMTQAGFDTVFAGRRSRPCRR